MGAVEIQICTATLESFESSAVRIPFENDPCLAAICCCKRRHDLKPDIESARQHRRRMPRGGVRMFGASMLIARASSVSHHAASAAWTAALLFACSGHGVLTPFGIFVLDEVLWFNSHVQHIWRVRAEF